MKKTLLLLCFSISLFAMDILTDYRENGIKNIQKEMDLELTKQDYWQKYLKNKDTSFGYIEKYSSILTCDKNSSTLKLYEKDKNSTFKFEKKYPAYTGKIAGDKKEEGDLKTPIGIYSITKKVEKLDPFYGPLAFVTSYPNIYDKFKGKNGHGIWIHGLPEGQERDSFTKGCIAIDNSGLKALDKEIDIKNTLLIINKTKISKNTSKEQLANILAQLYGWRYSWIYNNIDKYLKFYSDIFIKDGNMNLKKFQKYKTRIFKKNEVKTILFNDINVIKYPNTSNIYQITFKEVYKSPTFKFTGNKTLIVKIDSDNKMQILTER